MRGLRFDNMLEDARGGYDDDGGGDGGIDRRSGVREWVELISYACWLTWCFFVDPGSHTEKLDPVR